MWNNKLLTAVLVGLITLTACNSVKKITMNPCVSNSTQTTQRIVDSAACILNQLRTKIDGPNIDFWLQEARAVFIFPDIYKAAFMVGAEGGAGVLCAKDSTGFWNGPAFFNMAGVDIGLQGGVAGKTLLVFLMDEEALLSALDGKLDLSLGADLAIGYYNDSSHRGSSDVQGNVHTIVYQAGMFGGMTYRTGAFMNSPDYNKQYYGKDIDVAELLMTHKYDNPKADILLFGLAGAGQ